MSSPNIPLETKSATDKCQKLLTNKSHQSHRDCWLLVIRLSRPTNQCPHENIKQSEYFLIWDNQSIRYFEGTGWMRFARQRQTVFSRLSLEKYLEFPRLKILFGFNKSILFIGMYNGVQWSTIRNSVLVSGLCPTQCIASRLTISFSEGQCGCWIISVWAKVFVAKFSELKNILHSLQGLLEQICLCSGKLKKFSFVPKDLPTLQLITMPPDSVIIGRGEGGGAPP